LWIAGSFFYPAAFLDGVRHAHARALWHGWNAESNGNVGHANGEMTERPNVLLRMVVEGPDGGDDRPEGFYLSGLETIGCVYDVERQLLLDEVPGSLTVLEHQAQRFRDVGSCGYLHFLPTVEGDGDDEANEIAANPNVHLVNIPFVISPSLRGSNDFIRSVALLTDRQDPFWVQRGAALVVGMPPPSLP